MKEIKTREELKGAINKTSSVVMFGKENCLHCSIVQNCVESVEKHYPNIGFYYTDNNELSSSRNINAFPVLVFYENGAEKCRITGSGHIHKIKEIINLWITE